MGCVSSPAVQFLFHLSAFTLYLLVFCWHFTPEAASLPQASGFGWFYKFLTFCGFNLQFLTLLICLLSYFLSQSEFLKQLADDLSCSMFSIANVISILYWSVLVITMKPVEGDHKTLNMSPVPAPWYINLTVHLFNSIIAWIDVSICERSFRPQSLVISSLFAVGYICWSQYASSINKMYPYPFLNEMPQPQGYILVSAVSLLILYVISSVGAAVARHGSLKLKYG